MLRRSMLSFALVAATTLASTPALQASPLHFPGKRPTAVFGSGKTIPLTLRNGSGSPMELRIGSETTTLASGEVRSVRMAEGTRVLSTENTAGHTAGSLLLEVGPNLKNATVSLH